MKTFTQIVFTVFLPGVSSTIFSVLGFYLGVSFHDKKLSLLEKFIPEQKIFSCFSSESLFQLFAHAFCKKLFVENKFIELLSKNKQLVFRKLACARLGSSLGKLFIQKFFMYLFFGLLGEKTIAFSLKKCLSLCRGLFWAEMYVS